MMGLKLKKPNSSVLAVGFVLFVLMLPGAVGSQSGCSYVGNITATPQVGNTNWETWWFQNQSDSGGNMALKFYTGVNQTGTLLYDLWLQPGESIVIGTGTLSYSWSTTAGGLHVLRQCSSPPPGVYTPTRTLTPSITNTPTVTNTPPPASTISISVTTTAGLTAIEHHDAIFMIVTLVLLYFVWFWLHMMGDTDEERIMWTEVRFAFFLIIHFIIYLGGSPPLEQQGAHIVVLEIMLFTTTLLVAWEAFKEVMYNL